MKEIGHSLREAREKKGLSLGQVQQETKLRTRYLVAIEEGEFDALPGEPYVRGFIRNYCRAVGVDPQPILARYDNLRQQEAAAGEALEEPRPSLARSVWQRLQGTMEWLGL